jgi:hypothetical protein
MRNVFMSFPLNRGALEVVVAPLVDAILAECSAGPMETTKTEAPAEEKALAKREQPQEPGAVKQIVAAFTAAAEGYYEVRSKEIQAREKGAKLRNDGDKMRLDAQERRDDRETKALALVLAMGFAFAMAALVMGKDDILRDLVKIGGGILAGGLGGYGFGISRAGRRSPNRER